MKGESLRRRILELVSEISGRQEKTEDTLDFYARDVSGCVWYFGEISQQFEDGDLVEIEESWKAGVEGGTAGTITDGNRFGKKVVLSSASPTDRRGSGGAVR